MSLKGLKKRFSIRSPSGSHSPQPQSSSENLQAAAPSSPPTNGAVPLTTASAHKRDASATHAKRSSAVASPPDNRRSSVVLGYVQGNKDRLVAEHERSPLPASAVQSPGAATPHATHGLKSSAPPSGVASPSPGTVANMSAGMTPSGEVDGFQLQKTLAQAARAGETAPSAVASPVTHTDVAVADATDGTAFDNNPFAPSRGQPPPDEGYGLGSTATGDIQANWGTFPIVPDHTKAWKQLQGKKRESLADINTSRIGETVLFRARIHHIRSKGAKLCFLVFRQEYLTIQGVVQATVNDDLLTSSSRPLSILSGSTASPNSDASAADDETTTGPKGSFKLPGISSASQQAETIGSRIAAGLGLRRNQTTNPAKLAQQVERDALDTSLAPQELVANQSSGVLLGEGSAGSIAKAAGTEIPEQMVRWTEKLPRESVVLVEAVVKSPAPHQEKIKGTDIKDVELAVLKLYVIGPVTLHTPFSVEDAGQTDENEQFTGTSGPPGRAKRRQHVAEAIKITNRVITLRTPASHATFYLVHRVVATFEASLTKKGFVGIHSPKLQGGATESGASVFKVGYFGRDAFLAQSPQLAKQMAVGSGIERVFEVGPVFRAENSNTHRHLTEFTGLDIEMAFEEHYSEVRETINATLLEVFRVLKKECQHHVAIIRRQFPAEDLVIKGIEPGEKALRLTFKEGVDMLREHGWKVDGKEVSYYEDFNTVTEKELGKLVKKKYGTDYYMLDKFPLSARPFYTMPDPEDPLLSNSFDFFLRGEEILSGGQRIHHAPLLEARMKAARINPQTMRDYLSAFAWGMPQHGGAGVGLERIVMLYLGVGNVRRTSMFPRDPRSFQTVNVGQKKKKLVDEREVTTRVREDGTREHPEATLEQLIASYGDSPNTAWLDEGYTIFRHARTGAAIGFLTHGHYAICWGRPLCEDSQLEEVIGDFLAWLKAGGSKKKLHLPLLGGHRHEKEHHDADMQRVDTSQSTASLAGATAASIDSGLALDSGAEQVEGAGGLHPIWTCLDVATERVLARNHAWRSLICIAEDRIDPVHAPRWIDTPQVGRKMRQAMRAGVEVTEYEGTAGLPEDLMKKIDKKVEEWNAARQQKGDQIHVTDLRPFIDMAHRTYFVGRITKEAAAAARKKAASAKADGAKADGATAHEDGAGEKGDKKAKAHDKKKAKEEEKERKKKEKAEKAEKRKSKVEAVATDADEEEEEVVGLIVLSKLSPEHGFQLKWSLEFPNAPSGTSELCISTALEALRRDGIETATFGTGATGRVDPGGNVNVVAIRLLSKTYQALAKRFRLNQKSGYRMKFGAKEDPLYVAFPKSGLNLSGIDALIKALKH